MLFKYLKLPFAALFLCVFCQLSAANDSKGAFALTVENDLFSTSNDRHYTNGIQFSYTSDTYHPKWIEKLANQVPWYKDQDNTRFGVTIGQAIFTPEDITQTQEQPNERPYAGWLYVTFSLFSDSTRLLDGEYLDNTSYYTYSNSFELTLGTIGPSSLAEQAQKNVHELIGSPEPRGWDYQLKDEFGVNFAYTRQWQLPLYKRNIDVIPQVGGSLGTIYTYANTGLIFRFGNNLSKDFGPPLIRPSGIGSRYFEPREELEYYFFVGANGRYVARNAFLDGNMSKPGPAVNKKEWVGDLQFGLVMTLGDIQLSVTDVIRSREFKGQAEYDEFGSVNIIYRF